MFENLSTMDVCVSELNLPQNLNENYDENDILSESPSSDVGGSENESDIEYNKKLKERLLSLRATMHELKQQLKEERENWRREVDALKLFDKPCIHTEARENFNTLAETVQSFSLNGYEQKYGKRFEEILNNARKESRANLQRQIAISNYKRRLLEVENMCNMELLRVKQNVQFLQPLQMMASEWTFPQINEYGENVCHKTDSSSETSGSEEQKTKEVSMPLEMISNKLYNDMNGMLSKLTAQCNENSPQSVPQLHTTMWQLSDNKASVQSRSAVWYSECVPNKSS